MFALAIKTLRGGQLMSKEETMCLQHCHCYTQLSEDYQSVFKYNHYILKENRKLKEELENK